MHQALVLSPQNELVLVDMVTDTIDRHTGAYAPGFTATASGTWVAWTDQPTGMPEPVIHLPNFQTGASPWNASSRR